MGASLISKIMLGGDVEGNCRGDISYDGYPVKYTSRYRDATNLRPGLQLHAKLVSNPSNTIRYLLSPVSLPPCHFLVPYFPRETPQKVSSVW